MKKLLGALLLLCASSVHAQIIDFAYHLTASTYPLANTSSAASTSVGPYSGTPVLGDFIYFNGTNWVSLGKPADGTYSVLFTAGIPSWTAGGGGAATTLSFITKVAEASLSNEFAMGSLGTGLVINTTTTGVPTIYAGNTCTNQFARSDTASGTWTCASVGTNDISANAVTLAKLATQAANTTLSNATSGAAVPTAFAMPSCSDTGGNHINWVTNTGFTCGTSSSGGTVPTGTGFQFVTSGSIDAAAKTKAAAMKLMWMDTQTFFFREEFLKCGTGAGQSIPNFVTPGAGVGNLTDSPTGHPGVCSFSTSASASQEAYAFGQGASDTRNFILGGGAFQVNMSVRFPTLSATGTEQYSAHLGLCDLLIGSGDCNNGVYFEYDAATSTNWRICTAKGGTRTKTSTSTAVASNTWHALQINCDAGLTSCDFLIDGATPTGSPISTNIPNVSGTDPLVTIKKSVGTTARTLEADYFFMWMDMTATR